MMEQRTEFAYPSGLQIGEQPKSETKVLAATLLTARQAEAAYKTGQTLILQQGESVFTARPQDMVPAESKIVLREDSGELYGISAVTGG